MAGGKLISTGVEFPDATTQTTSGLPLTGGTMTGTIAGFTSTGIDDNATSTAITIDASENVGIGTTSPSGVLQIKAANPDVYITSDNTGQSDIYFGGTTAPTKGNIKYSDNSNLMAFSTNSSERMRIDTSGNVLVGKTSGPNYNVVGIDLPPTGNIQATRDGGECLVLNRQSNDGSIVDFRKDGTLVGSIECSTNVFGIVSDRIELRLGSRGIGTSYMDVIGGVAFSVGSSYDNTADLGRSSARFDDIYATNGTIQTSDRNEKQDIEELSTAETAVATACKGLMRKFRWQDAVAEKGDDARIHFGIIAQDLQDAFAAEGLDAGRYAMFISSTWYEKEVEVPAVEAVEAVEATYDDEGAELTPAVEAVEAKDAYTRADTEDEPTDGYTERTRLGVRYPELLAFIISAI